jgi:hypothetical protein
MAQHLGEDPECGANAFKRHQLPNLKQLQKNRGQRYLEEDFVSTDKMFPSYLREDEGRLIK